jgi:hypothetical protein
MQALAGDNVSMGPRDAKKAQKGAKLLHTLHIKVKVLNSNQRIVHSRIGGCEIWAFLQPRQA